MRRPHVEKQASRKDIRREELVDDTALDRARTNRAQTEPPLTFRGHRDELHSAGN